MEKHRGVNVNNAASVPENEAFTETLLPRKAAVLDDGLGPRWKVWKRRRYLVVLMAFLGEVTKEAMRTNLSVAVFPMTENTTATLDNGSTTYVQDFDWDVKTRGFLLSTFYYGFVSTHILGGVLAFKYGGTKLYGLGVASTAIFTLLTPMAARVHLYLLISLRILEGMFEGVLRPSLELIYVRWIPIEERSSLVAIVVSGNSWGIMIGMAASGAIAYHWGWPAIFYFTGAVGLVWYAAWCIFVKESPVKETNMSVTERTYIMNTIGVSQENKTKVCSVPYSRILTSGPLLALMIAYMCIFCNLVVLTTQLPAYIKNVLKLDTQNSGYVSSVPFATTLLGMYSLSWASDCLVGRRILTTISVRKLYISGCLAVMGTACLLIQLATSMPSVLSCLVVMNLSTGAAIVQTMVNMMDLAPSYSSVMSGLISTTGAASGIFIPTGIGYLTQNKTAEEWHTVFYILACVYLLAAAVYGIFGSARLQPWATENPVTAQENTGR